MSQKNATLRIAVAAVVAAAYAALTLVKLSAAVVPSSTLGRVEPAVDALKFAKTRYPVP